jgi:hypothetical protein
MNELGQGSYQPILVQYSDAEDVPSVDSALESIRIFAVKYNGSIYRRIYVHSLCQNALNSLFAMTSVNIFVLTLISHQCSPG